jgi:hypothetical protein
MAISRQLAQHRETMSCTQKNLDAALHHEQQHLREIETLASKSGAAGQQTTQLQHDLDDADINAADCGTFIRNIRQ